LEEISRQINWNVSAWMNALLYGGAFLGVALALWRLQARVRVWRRGTKADLDISVSRSITNVLKWMAAGAG